jgi:hypothetical protein
VRLSTHLRGVIPSRTNARIARVRKIRHESIHEVGEARAGEACRTKPKAMCSVACPAGLCQHLCNATAEGCEAMLKSEFAGSPCVEFDPLARPFMPLGRSGEAGGALAGRRPASRRATASERRRCAEPGASRIRQESGGATIWQCENQVRAACYVAERTMHDDYQWACFASGPTTRGQAGRLRECPRAGWLMESRTGWLMAIAEVHGGVQAAMAIAA